VEGYLLVYTRVWGYLLVYTRVGINLRTGYSRDGINLRTVYSRNVRTMGYTAGRNTSGNNPDLRRNREVMHNKPATESTSAQGMSEKEELSSRD